MRISIVKVEDYIILGLKLLSISLGLGKGLGVGLGGGLDIYKKNFADVATASLAQWRSCLTHKPKSGGSTPARDDNIFINN